MFREPEYFSIDADIQYGARIMSSELLSDVQGNILKGFNKPYMWLIFSRFCGPANTTQARRWLSEISSNYYRNLPPVPSTADLIHTSRDISSRRKTDLSYQPN